MHNSYIHTYIHTYIMHNIMTTCLILCWSLFCCQNSPDPSSMDSTRPLKVCCGTKMFVTDPLSPGNCEVGPPWIGPVCPAHPTDAQLDWDLGNLEAKSTPQTRGCAPQTSPEPFLLCGTAHYPADRGHSHHGILFPWKEHSLQQCLGRGYMSM